SAQDPVRKDVLELLLRVFDREELKFVPALQFSAPLVELEAIRHRGGSEAVGIDVIGSDGKPWLARHEAREELAPYYNPLNPRVQEAMLAVLDELVERCGKHPSLAGVAIHLSADGYAQMPGAEWGYDEDTLARFERETRVDLGPSGPEELPRRAALLAGRYRDAWLAWRAKTLAEFYRRAAAELTAARPDVPLYLATSDIFSRPDLQRQLRPALPQNTTPDDLLLAVGIDPVQLRDVPNVVLLRSRRFTPTRSLVAQAVNLQFNQSFELDDAFAKADRSGVLFLHERQEARLASFDAKSPFRNTHMRLVSLVSPSAQANRQRFIRALAVNDCQSLIDGGWLLPMGQEDELREIISVFRELPAGAFETLGNATQPVVVRSMARGDQTWLYAVNDSPWKMTVTLPVMMTDGCHLLPLGARRAVALQGEGVQRVCMLDLGPYELVGATITGGEVHFGSPKVNVPGRVVENLEARIRDLWSRTAALKSPTPLEGLVNADFEQKAPKGTAIAGWELGAQRGAEAKLDNSQPRKEGAAVRLSSQTSGAQLTSMPFPKPPSGRLSAEIWLHIADNGVQPTLRVGIEANDGETWYRYATVGAAGSQKLQSTWGQYIFPVTDLPGDTTSTLRLRFELVGAGTVWIDDIELFDLDFTDDERLELSKVITLAEYKRKSEALGDCLRVLDSYWPRYLLANVPLTQPLATKPETVVEPAAPPEPETKPGIMDRLRRTWPWR
ncbi:MAG TPA: hypothetical protein VHV77_02295, partial [Pirellulales bacterium]|nr:hypothetical protein [Pirellulales bacterium]